MLTYMSIRDEIKSRISEGRLFLLEPALTIDPCVRWIFVTPEVYDFVLGPWDSVQDEVRAGKLRADLDKFVTGMPISISAEPYRKPNTTYMSPIDPVADRVFEIRNRDKPGIRIFGSFAEKDVFVATTWNYRPWLGGPRDRHFRDMRERSKTIWNQLFNSYQPISGEDRNDIATNLIFV